MGHGKAILEGFGWRCQGQSTGTGFAESGVKSDFAEARGTSGPSGRADLSKAETVGRPG